MHDVAHHLQLEAVSRLSGSKFIADQFARSAYNRYYYAAFLIVRKALIQINEEYKHSLSHKSIPDLLRGKIQKRIKKIRARSVKLGDRNLISECDRVSSKNLTFATDYEKAYAIRVISDYTPETSIEFHASRFSLNGVSVNEAHQWLDKAQVWSESVLSVVRQENE